MSTYLYGVLRAARAPAAGRAPQGPPGLGRVRTVDAGGGLWLIASSAPDARFAPAAIEARLRDVDWVAACAVGHERVLAHFGKRASLLPVKLFTLFSTDERAIADVAARRRRIERLLARVAGRQEWGVRMRVDPAAAARTPARPRDDASAGTRFLQRKSAAQTTGRKALAGASKQAAAAYAALRRLAAVARRRPVVAAAGAAPLVMDGAFLLERGRVAAFRHAVTALARRLAASGYRVELTGPWPPYNFVDGA